MRTVTALRILLWGSTIIAAGVCLLLVGFFYGISILNVLLSDMGLLPPPVCPSTYHFSLVETISDKLGHALQHLVTPRYVTPVYLEQQEDIMFGQEIAHIYVKLLRDNDPRTYAMLTSTQYLQPSHLVVKGIMIVLGLTFTSVVVEWVSRLRWSVPARLRPPQAEEHRRFEHMGLAEPEMAAVAAVPSEYGLVLPPHSGPDEHSRPHAYLPAAYASPLHSSADGPVFVWSPTGPSCLRWPAGPGRGEQTKPRWWYS